AGTSEIMARALLLEGTELAPGGRGFARLRLEAPLVALAGDRFVVRSYSPIVTIGGGTLLDTDPPRLKRPARLAHLKILEAGAPEAVVEEHVRGARRRGRGARGPRQGPPGLARAAPESGPEDGRRPARAGVSRGGGGAAEPRGGAGPGGAQRRRAARALSIVTGVAPAGAREGIPFLPRRRPRGHPGQARRAPARAQGDRPG